MYDENKDNDLGVNPETHKEETNGTNFVMSDPKPEEVNKAADNSYREENSYQESGYNQSQPNQSQPNQPNRNPYSGQYDIPHYQQSYNQRMAQQNYIPDEPKKKPSGGFFKRAAGLVAGALVFGIVAGSTMVGVNWVADKYGGEETVEIAQTETVPTTEAVTNADNNNVIAPIINTNMDVSDIVDKAMPSVVAISSKVIYESQTWFGPMQREGEGSGSGFIVGKTDDELLIVTNNHVVQGAEELKVAFIDQTIVDASIKGNDTGSDLAVITVPLSSIPSETLDQIAVATLGNSDNIKVGQGVIAIGNALGYGQSVTVGYISALDRTVQTEDGASRNLMQTDAAINPGNSGGALLNMKGEVIGINSAKYSSTEVEGMGYAIPISKVQDIINTLSTKDKVEENKQGYLGIQCKNIDAITSQQLDMPQGVFIYRIVEGGAASKSDLREKDIITKFDGRNITTYDDLSSMMRYYEGGSTVTITVQSLENGQYVERNVDITLDTKPVEPEETVQQ